MQAVRENRYIILSKDFEKAYKKAIKKDDQEHDFYKWKQTWVWHWTVFIMNPVNFIVSVNVNIEEYQSMNPLPIFIFDSASSWRIYKQACVNTLL